MTERNIIVEKTFSFARRIIKFCEVLEQDKKYIVAKQLLRSGTAIGACVFEAQEAESRADFIHKMKIAAKEANETRYWLLLCKQSDTYPQEPELELLIIEISKILGKIIASSRRTG